MERFLAEQANSPKSETEQPPLTTGSEAVFDILEKYKASRNNDALVEEWEKKFREDPRELFSDENLRVLQDAPPEKRLVFLTRASRNLRVTPELVEQHFNAFPEDLDVVITLFEDNEGFSRYSSEVELYSLCAQAMEKRRPTLKGEYRQFDDYLKKSARRSVAPTLLLKNFEYKYGRSFEEFGAGARGFLKLYQKAIEMFGMGDEIIDTEQIFTSEYEALPDEQKAKFLRKCVAELQFSLVFEETYNSAFTAERVARDNQRTKERARMGSTRHNPAHSMVYRTTQPVSVFNQSKQQFQKEMDSTPIGGGAVEEYPFHRMLRAVLERMSTLQVDQQENTDVLVDFWVKNRNPIFGNEVAQALSNQDVHRAAGQLLDALKAEQTDKNPLTAMLYRLELGRVSISQEGVEYLERMYDLGEFNNPDYHVQRLTVNGEVGIFNEELELIKYFELGDLATEQKRVQAKVLDFVYETLFTGRQDEPPEEREQRLQYLEEFKKNYYRFAGDKMFETTGARLNNLTFKEQGWFLQYFDRADSTEKERVRNFVSLYEQGGIRSFLSMEHDEAMGGRILRIGEQLEAHPQAARELFEGYGVLVDQAGHTAAEMVEALALLYPEKHFDGQQIAQAILIKARDLLLEVDEQLPVTSDEKKERVVDEAVKNIFSQIESQRRQLEEFRIVSRELQESSSINESSSKHASYRANLEQRLEGVLYGQVPGSIRKEVLARISTAESEVRPELTSEQKPLYFPVGISKDMPSWQAVERGEKSAAKPIDMYGYLLWLHNQGRPVELVVCDEIQASNYANLYPEQLGNSPLDAARDEALRIGKREAENYRSIIETLGLTNISVIDYRSFIERNGDAFQKYQQLCEVLAKQPAWADAFLAMVQESVASTSTPEEKAKYLPYATEEVAWILSTNGTKVSHVNEARYDALAAVIRNVVEYCQKHAIDPAAPDQQGIVRSVGASVVNRLREITNAAKDKAGKGSNQFDYFKSIGERLQALKFGKQSIPADFDKKDVHFNFTVAQTGAQSFGWRSLGEGKNEDVTKFKEPYSTYFYSNNIELFLNSDQVVAAEDGPIAGKILAVSHEKQEAYTEKVIVPLLAHFFRALDSVPSAYFQEVGKTRDAILGECNQQTTLPDLLRFIQKYVVRPTLQRRQVKSGQSKSKSKAA